MDGPPHRDPDGDPQGGDAMERLLAALKAVSEPTRLRILALCRRSELSVTDLTQILGQSQPRVSRHLKLLCDARLLDRFREGTFAYFRLADRGPGARLAQSLVTQIPPDDPVLKRDAERLDAIKRERATQAAAYFRDNAAQWDEIRGLHIADSEVEREIIDLMPQGGVDDLLDLGTGTGRMLVVLGPLARRGIGIDMSREMLALARAHLDRAGLPQCQVRQGDLYQLPLPSSAFDFAVMHQVLHFLEDPADALAEAARVIRPGGVLVIADFAAHELAVLQRDHAHRWLGFPDETVARWLADAGFQPERIRHLPGGPLTVSVWAARRTAAAAGGHARVAG